MATIPTGARKLAHYWYSDGNEIVIFAHKRRYFIRDGRTGEYPFDPTYGRTHPHPDEGESPSDSSYDALGLYYGYEMRDTGWSGDC